MGSLSHALQATTHFLITCLLRWFLGAETCVTAAASLTAGEWGVLLNADPSWDLQAAVSLCSLLNHPTGWQALEQLLLSRLLRRGQRCQGLALVAPAGSQDP